MRGFAVAALALTLLSGCAANISPSTYSVGSVGQINRTVAATVVSVRIVDVSGSTGLGTTTGLAAGAVAGSAIGGGTRANVLGAIGGALIAGAAGAIAEGQLTKQQAYEYIVETSNGNLMTIVQGGDPVFTLNQQVFVLYGSPARLIADRRQ